MWVIAILPLTMALGRCRRRAIFSVTGGLLSSCKSRGRRWGTTSNATGRRWVRMVELALVPIARGYSPVILDDGSNLGSRAADTRILWRALDRAIQSGGWRWRWWRTIVCMSSIVRIRDTVERWRWRALRLLLRLLLLMRR